MLELGVDDQAVEVGVAVEHRGVVAVHERSDPGLRVALAQRAEEGRGADQVPDVVAPHDEDAVQPFSP
jgi:hypothetical protein